MPWTFGLNMTGIDIFRKKTMRLDKEVLMKHLDIRVILYFTLF